MFLTPEELNTNMYSHIINEITDGEVDIVAQKIKAAICEVSSYLSQRYDTEKIFSAKGDARDDLILEQVKDLAIWNILKLSSAETLYDQWEKRYESIIDYLTKVAKGIIVPAKLPHTTNDSGEVTTSFKFGSNAKFNHEL